MFEFVGFYMADALPDATLQGSVSPPGLKPVIIPVSGDCVNRFTLEPLTN